MEGSLTAVEPSIFLYAGLRAHFASYLQVIRAPKRPLLCLDTHSQNGNLPKCSSFTNPVNNTIIRTYRA